MAWHYVTRSCGHEERFQITGNSRYREWQISKLEGEPCSDCVEARRQEENAAATKENAEAGLPALLGSERQVGWAETIRKKILDEVDSVLSDLAGKDWFEDAMRVVMSQQSASWWIDRRGMSLLCIVEEAGKQIKAGKITPPPSQSTPTDVLAEATLRPADPRTETVAEIAIRGQTIHITFPERRESFRALMHGHGFLWSSTHWTRTMSHLTGTAQDRAAEAAADLLRSRYIVRVFDPAIREKATNGDYSPEAKKWIVETDGRFGILWPKDTDYYAASRKLPGSRWDSQHHQTTVPAEQYELVLGFAESHCFSISEKARALAENARAIAEASLLCEPRAVVDSNKDDISRPKLTPSEVEIDESLRDDD